MKTRTIASLLPANPLSLATANFAAAADGIVKMGPLSDGSGPYAALGGQGSTLAAPLAVEGAGLTGPGSKVDVICGDHPNPDIGTAAARQWFGVDKGDVIVDAPNSGVALAGRGLNFTETFNFDMNDHAFSKRFADPMKNGAPPTVVQAGVYAGPIRYFKAPRAVGGNPHDAQKSWKR